MKQTNWRNTPILAPHKLQDLELADSPLQPCRRYHPAASASLDSAMNWRATPVADAPAQDFNPHHDPHSGEFASGGGSGGGSKQEKPGKYHVRPEGTAQNLMNEIMKKGAENATFAEKREVVMAQMTKAQMRRMREKGRTLSRSEVNNQFEARALRERLSNAKSEKERRAIEKEYESSFE